MITLEQVERLREKANVSYDEAKAALEEANGDLLEALINLEKQGKVNAPEGNGYYSSDKTSTAKAIEVLPGEKAKQKKECNGGFRDAMRKLGRFFMQLLHKGNSNSFEVLKNGEVKASLAITVVVVLLICFFWVTVPLLVIGLFFGFRYRFRGPDLGKEVMNNAMDSAAEAAENIKKSFATEEKSGE
ncbi:MAG: ubiquitin [Eubacteriales bacterium]|nr:ubiquitin [Eubacteriales bacterium]MDD3349826.1 ubiquitin [Eubacteriales bacterium]